MHVTASGARSGSALLEDSRSNALMLVLAGLVSSVQMGLLGALITLAPRTLMSADGLAYSVF
jgi:hypothetical protein